MGWQAGAAIRRLLPAKAHPLAAYASRRDDAYTWCRAGELPVAVPGTGTRLHLISQVWRGIPWKHELDVIRPAACARPGIALLVVAAERSDPAMLRVASRTAALLGLPTAVLFDIPNQPLFGGKSEDALIAHTFLEYLRTRDQSWPLLYPMVKSVVRAMDTLQELSAREWGAAVSGFVVTGASKRGWTTWLTGAVDPRVAGIAPLVYDNLNVGAQMAHQAAVYGRYSEQVSDYVAAGLFERLATPEGRELTHLVDPYTLRDRLHIPKLLIHGSNDRYWTLDSANLYYEGLPGDKHVLYVPNCGHGLKELPPVLSTLAAFTAACAEGRTLPHIPWDYREGRRELILSMAPQDDPVRVVAWTAVSPTRDFRDARWRPNRLRDTGHGYAFTLARPRSGYAAVFGETTHRWSGGTYRQSTTPRVIGPPGT